TLGFIAKRSGTADSVNQRSGAPDSICLRRQSPSTGSEREGSVAKTDRLATRSLRATWDRLYRRLRSGRRATVSAICRCLDERAAPAAGSFRYQRPEGGHQQRLAFIGA